MVKHLVSCGIAFIALAVSGWSNASTLDIPELCGEFDILNDPENRVYRGELKWKRDTLETALSCHSCHTQRGHRGVLRLGGAAEVENQGSGLRSRSGLPEGRHHDPSHERNKGSGHLQILW